MFSPTLSEDNIINVKHFFSFIYPKACKPKGARNYSGQISNENKI